MRETTLARKLRLAPHLSLLQRKARRLGLQKPEDWIALAVERGCYHYDSGERARPVPPTEFSNEELAALLLSVANPYRPLLIRVAAQLLSAPATDMRCLIQLCRNENALGPLAWIGKAGEETEPDNPFWVELNRQIRQSARREIDFPLAVLPHPSRFRVESGFQRYTVKKTIEKRWLRPIPRSS